MAKEHKYKEKDDYKDKNTKWSESYKHQENNWNNNSELYFQNPDDSPSTAQHCPVKSSTAQYSLVPPTAVQYHPVQSSIAYYSSVQPSYA